MLKGLTYDEIDYYFMHIENFEDQGKQDFISYVLSERKKKYRIHPCKGRLIPNPFHYLYKKNTPDDDSGDEINFCI